MQSSIILSANWRCGACVIHADVDRFSSIAPACDNYSDCLSGCYRIHQKYCFVDQKTGNKGIGAAGVLFWKWMLESGPSVEEAIVRSKAVPLVHTANNTNQIRAVTFTSDTIHCAHPPDPIVTDDTMTYIISACAGGGALLVILFVGWFVMERHAMMNNPLRGVNVLQVCLNV